MAGHRIGRELQPWDFRAENEAMMDLSFRHVDLERRTCAISVEIDRRDAMVYSRSRVEQFQDEIRDRLRLEMRMDVWGEKEVTRPIAKVPATYQDALKLALVSFFDNPVIKWYVRRHPIQYKTVEASFNVHYPDFKPSLPEQDYVCRVAIMGPPQFK